MGQPLRWRGVVGLHSPETEHLAAECAGCAERAVDHCVPQALMPRVGLETPPNIQRKTWKRQKSRGVSALAVALVRGCHRMGSNLKLNAQHARTDNKKEFDLSRGESCSDEHVCR